jgi:cytidyltransferase-like protein
MPKKMPKTRIMVFGTFDGLHKGHLNFFKQARKLSRNPFLIVSVARDVNVKKIKSQKPFFKEARRKSSISKNKLVNKVVLGGVKNHLPHILKERPSIIALGYDQSAYIKGLKQKLEAKGLAIKIFRLKPFHPQVYKSSLVKKQKT